MRILILLAALVAACPVTGRADELSDLKAQLDAAMKSIQALQQRVEALEAEKAKAPAAPTAAEAAAPTPAEVKTTVAPAPAEAKEAAAAPAAAPTVAAGAPVVAPNAVAEKGAPDPNKARLEITGKVQLDAIYDFKRMNPDWNATERPSQIPVNCPGDAGCGKDGETIFSVRQTAIGFKGFIPTSLGELKTDLSFDLFGSGGGNTQIRVLNAWGELGQFGARPVLHAVHEHRHVPQHHRLLGTERHGVRAQPAGALHADRSRRHEAGVLARGAQCRHRHRQGLRRRPDARRRGLDPLAGLRRQPAAWNGDWGHFQAAGILRPVGYQTHDHRQRQSLRLRNRLRPQPERLAATPCGKDRIIGQLVYGHAIASYMNDGGVDLAPNASLQAETVPSLGWFALLRPLLERASGAARSASARITRTTPTDSSAPPSSRAATPRPTCCGTPVKNVMTGAELLWGKLEQQGRRVGRRRARAVLRRSTSSSHGRGGSMDFLQAFPDRHHRRGLRRQARRRARHAAARRRDREGRLPRRRRPQLRGRAAAGATSSTPNRAGWSPSTAPRPTPTQWQILEEVLAAKRRRNDRLPIFLFGDERTAEMVPARVLKHANAFMRLFEDSPEFLARAIARSAQLYLERLPPPMFKALMDYTLHASYSWHTPGHGGGVGVPQEPGRPAVLRVLRREHAALRHLGLGGAARLAARPHRPDRRGRAQRGAHLRRRRDLFVVGGTSTSNKIVWHGMVGARRPGAVRPQLPQVDPALADHDRRDADLPHAVAQRPRASSGRSRATSSRPSRSGRRSPPARSRKETSGKVRLMVMTNSTYDGLCYNVDAIKQTRRRRGRRAALRRGLVRLREFPRVLRRLSRASRPAQPGALATRHHLRHAVDAQAAGRAVAGVDDPHPARRERRSST